MPNETDAGIIVHHRIECLEKEVARLQVSLHFLIRHDPLTGCWNRVGILDILHQEVARVQRQHSNFGLIVFGADNFNSLNDEYGKEAGDAVLRAMARRVRPSVRPYDSLGRSGDNEFLIVAPGCVLDEGLSMAERIRALFAEESTDITRDCTDDDLLDPPEERRVPVTLSVGVFATPEPKDPGSLLNKARAAYQLAKRKGGNRVMAGDTPVLVGASAPTGTRA